MKRSHGFFDDPACLELKLKGLTGPSCSRGQKLPTGSGAFAHPPFPGIARWEIAVMAAYSEFQLIARRPRAERETPIPFPSREVGRDEHMGGERALPP